MDDYHAREQEKYRKEQSKGSAAYLLISLGVMAAFIPVAVAVVGSMKAYKRIREVFEK